MIYFCILGFFLQMQLLHMWSYPKKWEKFGIHRVCRVLSRLPCPRKRDKSIVAKFQQQTMQFAGQSQFLDLTCLFVCTSVMLFTRSNKGKIGRGTVIIWHSKKKHKNWCSNNIYGGKYQERLSAGQHWLIDEQRHEARRVPLRLGLKC